MFEELFTHPGVVRKHVEGPFVDARRRHLEEMAAAGHPRGTLLRHAAYGLCVARVLDQWPRFRESAPIEAAQLDAFATQWAAERLKRRARTVLVPRRSFLQLARALLIRLGRLAERPADPLEKRAAEFAEAHAERWSPNTRRNMARHVLAFLRFVDRRGVTTEGASYAEIDAFLCEVRKTHKPPSIKVATGALRAWFEYAPSRGWAPPGLVDGIWQPRVYSHAGLLPGPTPEQVRATIAAIRGDGPAALRDRAIFLLLSTYGFRASEVCRLALEDLDWTHDRLRVSRSKGGRSGWVPLQADVGAAIARYLRKARPKTSSRAVFLRVRAPYRELSTTGLYNIVAHHLRAACDIPWGRGPHGLRHASARALLAGGASLKTIGDHLGHRSADATGIYAKVDATSLRQVAWTDVEGLA